MCILITKLCSKLSYVLWMIPILCKMIPSIAIRTIRNKDLVNEFSIQPQNERSNSILTISFIRLFNYTKYEIWELLTEIWQNNKTTFHNNISSAFQWVLWIHCPQKSNLSTHPYLNTVSISFSVQLVNTNH